MTHVMDVDRIKIITSSAIKTTGKLIVITKTPNLLVCLASRFRRLFGVFQRIAGLSQSETS
jgi:hypothetical protein